MAKNIFHDIVPPEKRSIRNIKIHNIRNPETVKEDVRRADPERGDRPLRAHKAGRLLNRTERPENDTEDAGTTNYGVAKAPKKGIWFVALICFLALVFSVLYLISTAEVNIKVKKFSLDLSDDMSALKDGDGLTYSSIVLSDNESLELTSIEQKEVSIKATGSIIIYNTQGVPQTLIANTRFEAGEGNIFLLDKRVVVPAQKTVSGKKVPGSVEATIEAQKPGSKYNVGLADFTVVAFKGDPRFNAVYGRSKSEIAGGALGTVPVLSQNEIAEAKKEILNKLTQKILASANAEIPVESVLLDNLYDIKIEVLPEVIKEGKVIFREKATLTGYIFDKKNFVEYISKLKNQAIPINNSLALDSSDIKITSLKEENDTLKFNISGALKITYNIDVPILKKEMKGKNKSEVLHLLAGMELVESAQIKTYPLWLIPRNTDRIKVSVD